MRAWTLIPLLVIVAASLALTQPTQNATTAGSTPQASNTRTILITGANRGLGLEFAKQYAAAGWNVIGTARKPAEAEELRATGARIIKLDVTSDADVARMAKELEGQSIDLLINNAGISSRGNSVNEIDIDRAKLALDVNLLGPMRVTAALMPNLRAGSGKTIVAISSGLGSIEMNTGGRYIGYRESKAGVNMFMRTLAAELRSEGFICITMSPGWVRTDMGGPDATLSPEQSISGMRTVIDALTPEHSGRYWGHDGAELPW